MRSFNSDYPPGVPRVPGYYWRKRTAGLWKDTQIVRVAYEHEGFENDKDYPGRLFIWETGGDSPDVVDPEDRTTLWSEPLVPPQNW